MGRGKTFKVFLPRVVNPAGLIQQARSQIQEIKNTGTILLVEDEDRLQRSIQLILERAGYTMLPASHGYEALQILEENEGQLDFVLTDIGLPQMQGTELVERLKKERPNIGVLYMSGSGGKGVHPDETSELSDPFLQKPFRRDSLLRKLDRFSLCESGF